MRSGTPEDTLKLRLGVPPDARFAMKGSCQFPVAGSQTADN
jgi:hypothetical protein